MKTIRANRYVLLQTVYDDYKTRLTAGDLTQSSCSYDNDLAYDLDISPCRGTQTSVYILFP